MRILIYGAGVIGSCLAADLFASGRDVTLLARGDWADRIEQNGLLIDPILSPRKKCFSIPVIRQLRKEDRYDVIFVVMRYTQLDSVIPILKENCSSNIVFTGNNLSLREYAGRLPGKNVMFAFSMAAGHREKDRVVSVSLRKITIGQLRGCLSNEGLIHAIFDGTGIRAIYQPNMEDYLLSHAAFVVPIAFACYACDGDLKRIKNNRAYLNRMIDATVEGYAAIENAGHEILPASDQNFRSEKFRYLCYAVYKVMCSTVIGKICASDHAMNAVEEMSALNEGLKKFFRIHQVKCPNYSELEKDAERYFGEQRMVLNA